MSSLFSSFLRECSIFASYRRFQRINLWGQPEPISNILSLASENLPTREHLEIYVFGFQGSIASLCSPGFCFSILFDWGFPGIYRAGSSGLIDPYNHRGVSRPTQNVVDDVTPLPHLFPYPPPFLQTHNLPSHLSPCLPSLPSPISPPSQASNHCSCNLQ